MALLTPAGDESKLTLGYDPILCTTNGRTPRKLRSLVKSYEWSQQESLAEHLLLWVKSIIFDFKCSGYNEFVFEKTLKLTDTDCEEIERFFSTSTILQNNL